MKPNEPKPEDAPMPDMDKTMAELVSCSATARTGFDRVKRAATKATQPEPLLRPRRDTGDGTGKFVAAK